MAAPLILSISEALVSFGKKPLFEDLSFNIITFKLLLRPFNV